MRSAVVLSWLLTAAAACIPTKTPQPGIPAVTPKECTKYGITSMAVCNMLGPGVCDPVNLPMLSGTAMSCAGGANLNIIVTPAGGGSDLFKSVLKAACANGVWNDSTGSPLIGTPPPPGAVLTVICEG